MITKYKEGYNNKIGVSGGVNELLATGLVPLTPLYNMVVTIHAPILPSVDSKKKIDKPNISSELTLALLPQYRDLIDIDGDLNVLFNYFFSYAKDVVDFEVIGNDVKVYELLVSYHTAHHLETHLRAIKDEANKASLNEEVVEKNIYLNEMYNLLEKGQTDSYLTTWAGSRFTEMYLPFVQNKIKGGYTNYAKYGRLR